MKAMQLNRFNEPLEMTELQKPVPQKGQVLVRISASGINPLDLKIREGQAAHAQVKPPFVLGLDMAGKVEALGEGVSGFKIGDEVYGMVGGVGANQGTLAEYVAADVSLIALKPKNLSMREAAAVPLIFITAWEGIVDHVQVKAEQKILILGGAGGVGHMALQIAKAFGANVAANGGATSQKYIQSLGATAFDYGSPRAEEELAAFTSGAGFDAIYDTVGGPSLDLAFKNARKYTGHVVSCLGWGTYALAPLSFRSATYSGVFTLSPLLSGFGRKHHGEILREATSLIEGIKVVPKVDKKVFQLSQINGAYEYSGSGKADGKVVVEV